MIIVYLVFVAIDIAIAIPIIRYAKEVYGYWQTKRSNRSIFLNVLESLIILMMLLTWLFIAGITLGAIFSSFSSGPEPFFLLPWFAGAFFLLVLWWLRMPFDMRKPRDEWEV